MKKFTRLWQLMMILLLSSSVAFGQYKSAIPTNTADAKAKQSEKVNNQAEKTRVSKQMQVMQDEEMQSPASEINTAAPSQVTAPADLTKQEEIKKAQEATQSAAIQAQGASISAYLDKPMSNAVYDPKLYPVPDQGGDDIATAVVLSGALPITSSGTTSGYTDDYDEICPYGPSTAPDVVYSYTPAGNQDVDIDLCGSLYDTKLFVYENAYTPGAPFACNDDFYTVAGDPCGQWVSKIEGVTLTGGNTYYIVVDGYDAASFGDYSLEIRDYVPPDPCVWGIDIQCPTGATAETELCGEDLNGGCNLATPVFEPVPETGATICGTVWADGGNRDTDWFELTLTAASNVVLTADADVALIYGLISDASGVPSSDCGTASQILPNNTGGACNETMLDLGALSPGTYWFFAGMTVYEGFPCENHYYLTFDITPVPCSPPTGTTTTQITTTSARANWVAGGTETLWNFEWGPTGFTQGTGNLTTGYTNPNPFGNPYFNIPGLSQGMTYDWYVQADCGTEEVSPWVGPITFSTLCDPVAPPYTENFDGVTAPAIPNCIVVENVNADLYTWETYTSLPHSAPNSITVRWNSAEAMNDWFYTAPLALTGGVEYTVDFFFKNTSTTYIEKLEVKWGTAANAAAMTNGPVFDNNNITGLDWTYGSGTFTPASTGTYYVGFHGYSDADQLRLYVDDVSVYETPDCPTPYGLQITNVTETTADLTWTSPAGLSNIEYGPAGFSLGGGTSLPGVTSPQTLTGLSASTLYDVYYQDDCGTDVESPWVGPVQFNTPAAAGELIAELDVEAIVANGDNQFLGAQYLNGSLWLTTRGDLLGGPSIYEIDVATMTLLNTYPQTGVTSLWGMRDLATDGTYLYAGDDNGFYQIDPADGTVTTLFSPSTVGIIRALAYNPTTSNFFCKDFGNTLYEFDDAGNIINSWTLSNSAYGAAWDASTSTLWIHATSTLAPTPTEFIQFDPVAGSLTGMAVGVPDSPCSVTGIVGGGFIDFGNMYPGRNIFGGLLQGTPDVVQIVEYSDTGYPDQVENFMPFCGEINVPLDGSLMWDFGANTDTYDLWFGPEGAMVQVVTGAAVGGPTGSYAYTGLTEGQTYEWRVDGYNATDLGPTIGYTTSFTAIPPPYTYPFVEHFDAGVDPTDWLNTSSNTAANGIWEYGNDVTNTPGYTVAGTPDHTGTGGFYAWSDGSTPVVADMTFYTPFIDPSGLTVPWLQFFILSNNGTTPGDNCTFICDFWDGAAWNNLLTYAGDDPNWQEYSFDLSGYTITGNVQFRFIVDQTTAGTAFYNDILFDDVFFGEMPTCPDPTDLDAINITATSADLVWTSNSGLSDIEFGAVGFVPSGTPTDPGVTSPFNVTGLSAGMGYDFYVRDDCGGEYSNWVGPHTFYTPPANDDCGNAEAVVGPFPTNVSGTNLGATIDCAGVLDWNAVWYSIDLPYDMNLVEIDMCMDDAGATLSSTGIILTSDCSCDPLSFLYSTGEWVVSANCITDLNFEVAGPATVYYPVYADPAGDFNFDINVSELYSIDGTVTYANAGMSPMELITLTLDDGSDAIIATTYTDLSGNYMFENVPAGTYTINSMTDKERGGTNILDAINTRQYLGGAYPMDALQQAAADVNNNSNVDILDAILIQQSLSGGQPAGWTAPDWIFEDPTFTLPSKATQDFRAICSGDPNGSYIPPAAPAGAVCENAIPWAYAGGTSDMLSQTNCGLGNFYSETCLDLYDGGEDIIYELTVTGDWVVDITLDPKGTTYTGLLVSDVCPPTTACLDFSTNSGGTAHGIEALSLTAGTYYIMVDTWPAPDCIPDFDLTISEWVPSYCNSNFTSVTYEYITNVTFGAINNTSAGTIGGPVDYTAQSTDVQQGGTYPISVTIEADASDYVYVWIDWNQNFILDDAGEQYTVVSSTSLPGPHTINIDVPAGATLGNTRMRVMCDWNNATPNPCRSATFGEAEDYTVNVTP